MIDIIVNEKGAELTSIKFNGKEKLHDGLKDWNRHSPVLFPIVGKLKNGKTNINGREYEMGQHGFARDMNFQKISENKYILESNKETLEKYPFRFKLYIEYETTDDEVKCKYKVVNEDNKKIYFGLGAHPAFICDYTSGEYELKFEQNEENLETYQLENGLVKEEKSDLTKNINSNGVKLDKDIFKDDAIILENLKSNKVTLIQNNEKVLEVDFKGFKYLGIWSKPNAKFLCIEPWMNTADKVNSNGIYEEKEDIIRLSPNEEFNIEWKVKFY